MNKSRTDFASATLLNEIYACGGYDAQYESLGTAEVYDPVLDVWGFLPNMTKKRDCATSVAFKNKVYVIGGYDGDQTLTSVEIFNPATNEWSFGPSLQIPRLDAKAIVYNGKIFVIGGDNGNYWTNNGLKTVEVYDPQVSANWIVQQQQLTVGRFYFAVTLLDNKILISGGHTGDKI